MRRLVDQRPAGTACFLAPALQLVRLLRETVTQAVRLLYGHERGEASVFPVRRVALPRGYTFVHMTCWKRVCEHTYPPSGCRSSGH